jgi:hypothetical protein
MRKRGKGGGAEAGESGGGEVGGGSNAIEAPIKNVLKTKLKQKSADNNKKSV